MKKLILALIALPFTACVESALNPTDKVALSGEALNEDRTPIANTELKLQRSGGSACLIVTDFKTVTTDGSGTFKLDLTGADTQTDDKVARCFRLSLPAGEKGAQVYTDFLIQVTDPKVPALQRWTGAVAAAGTATGADFTFTELTKSQTGFPAQKYTAEVVSGGGLIWRKTDATSPVSLSDYVLEDFQAANAVAVASPELKGSGTTFHYRHQTDSAALPAKQKVPASRGAKCAYNKAPTECPLTDGKATRVLLDTVPDITFTLAAAKAPKKIVLRGFGATLPSNVVLESSQDGTTFTKVVDLSTNDFQEVDIPAGTTAAKTWRIKGSRTDNGAFNIITLDEVSLFE